MSIKTYALTTVARLCQFLGIAEPANPSADYSQLERIIDITTAYIENQIGFRVQQTTYTNEEYSTDGSGNIVLRGRPISSSDSISLQNRASGLNDNSWDTIASNLYVVDYDGGIISGMGSYKFSNGQSGFRVTYTAGYDFDNSTTFLSDTEGGDLEYVMWKLCKAIYDSIGSDSGLEDVESESIGDYSVTFAMASFGDSDVTNILERYTPLGFGAGRTPSQNDSNGHW